MKQLRHAGSRYEALAGQLKLINEENRHLSEQRAILLDQVENQAKKLRVIEKVSGSSCTRGPQQPASRWLS